MYKLIFLLTVLFAFPLDASAQGGVFQPRPSAKPDICTSATLGTTCAANQDGRLAWNSTGEASEADGDCKTGTPGTTRVLCAYHASAGKWKPVIAGEITGLTNPLAATLDANGNTIQNVGTFDFLSLDCTGQANGGKLTTNGSGTIICAGDTSGGGGGSWDGGLVITNPPNFVGTVFCPTGVVDGCTGTAVVTQLNGQVLADGYLELAGTYHSASPQTTTDGFKINVATFLPFCNNTGYECGDDFSTFAGKIQTLATQYDPYTTGVAASKHIKFVSYGYQIDPSHPFKLDGSGWTLDFCDGPAHFDVIGTAWDTTAVIPQTAVIDGSPNATHTLTCTNCNFCGTGTCGDGDEKIRPGDAILLGTNGAWDTGRVNFVGSVVNDITLDLILFESADYSGQITTATGKAWEFDSTDPQKGIIGDVEMMCGGNAQIACSQTGGAKGFCSPPNAWSTPALTKCGVDTICGSLNDPNDPNSIRDDHRIVPLQGIVNRLNETNINMSVTQFRGKNDASVTFGGNNQVTSTVNHGEFTGLITLTGSPFENKMLRTDANDTTSADDGFNSVFRIMSPNVRINPRGLVSGGNIYALLYGGSCGNLDIDGRLAENFAQVLYAPGGCQNLRLHDVSREQQQFCDGGGQPTCETLAARRPFIDIGPWVWDESSGPASAYTAYYDFSTFGKVFFDTTKRPFLRITDSKDVRVDLNAVVEDTPQLLQISSNTIEVNGNVQCRASGGDTTACDVPALGTYPDLIITNESQTVLADTRDISKMTKAKLALAQLTDNDTTANLCLVSGGGGAGVPNYVPCPGGGSLTVDEADGTPIYSAITTMRFDQADGFVVTNPSAGIAQIDLAAPLRLTQGNTGITPVDSTKNFVIGNSTEASAEFRFNADGSWVLNETGAAVNGRMEANGQANMFYVDGTNARIGIGTNAPTVQLDMTGSLRIRSLNCSTYGNSGKLTTDASGNVGCANDVGGGGGTFAALTDVAGWTPSDNQVVRYTGTGWVNEAQNWTTADGANAIYPTDGDDILVIGDTGTSTADHVLDPTGAATFNKQKKSADFSVSSLNVTNMLFVDGSADRVGIGTASPTDTLEVAGTLKATSATIGGVTISSSGVDVPAHANNGGAITLKEGVDDGTPQATWSMKVPDTGLTGTGSYTIELSADGKIPTSGITGTFLPTVVDGTDADKCAKFNSSGVLVAASGDCASGDTTGGTPVLNAVLDPDAATDLIFGATSETFLAQFTAAITTGSQFLVQQTSASASGGVLLESRVADVDVVAFKAGDGTNGVQVSGTGALAKIGTGTITATALSCTDCVDATQISELALGGTTTSGNYVAGATTNLGLVMSGTEGGTLGLIDCGVNEILKSVDGTTWVCSTDLAGSAPTFDAVLAPAADVSLAFDSGEELAFNFTTTTAIDLFTVTQAGNATGGSIAAFKGVDADSSPMVRIENTSTANIPIGLQILGSNTGDITTGIDVSDADVPTAINIGPNMLGGSASMSGDLGWTANAIGVGSNAIVFEAAADAIEGSLTTAALTTTDRTWILPNDSGSIPIVNNGGSGASLVFDTGGTQKRTYTGLDSDMTLARTSGTNSFTGTQTFGSATSLLLGTAGSAVGDIGFRNAATGTITLAPPTGALGTVALTLPTAAGALVSTGDTGTVTSGMIATELRSMYFDAGALSTDGTNCTAPAEFTLQATGPKTWTVKCPTDSASAIIYGKTVMPDGWDAANTLTFELNAVDENAAPSGTYIATFSAMCRTAGADTVGTTWGSGVAATITFATQYRVEAATTGNVTPNGTACAAGDVLFWRAVLNTGTTTQEADSYILGVKMEYTTNVGD